MSTGLLSVDQQYMYLFDLILLTFDVSLRQELSIQCIFYNLETTHSDCAQVHLAKYSVLIFLSLLFCCSYEAHYNSLHRHTCLKCQRSFPSTHLLEIHVLENHDALFSMIATRKNLVMPVTIYRNIFSLL